MTVRVLGISGSPRKGGSTAVMVRAALDGAAQVAEVETDSVSLAGRRLDSCRGCFKCVERGDLCIFRHKDSMAELYKKWLWADGLIVASPVYHLSVPGVLKSFIDRLGEGVWAAAAQREPSSKWLCKVAGVMTQGMATFGGQEQTIQYLVSHLLLMNCLVVPPEHMSVPGVAGTLRGNLVLEPGRIAEFDPGALERAREMGRRVAEVTRIVHAGAKALQNELPSEYRLFVLTKEGYEEMLDRKPQD